MNRDIVDFTMFDKYPDVVGANDLQLMLNGISRKLAYKLLKSGAIQSVKIGREYKIAKIRVIEYILGKSENSLVTSIPQD